ncbi:MAG: tRNA (adenosine(37)-N6)-threonylcarbamoyltransferase complex ATPase subunit type 1 TsaE, partial [Rhodospirillaceae bacterium]|nr:tRNA (adenosine(37)-N6)-threonylcarbamoyltransferase complex ATPase subunit type 1 TsaE [Rhodospirillaceae bacterium]
MREAAAQDRSVEAARSVSLPDEAATDRLGRALAGLARVGDVIALWGDLGAGKTRLARAFIRALTGGEEEVPSPTFTLVQTYDAAIATIWHFDLYRLASPEEVLELGFEEALSGGIVVIEWPGRLGGLLPRERLDVRLRFVGTGAARHAELQGHGRGWADRVG